MLSNTLSAYNSDLRAFFNYLAQAQVNQAQAVVGSISVLFCALRHEET